MEVVINVKEDHPYFPLAQVFEAAFNQASAGKGNERHAYSSDENYRNQLICEMDRRLHGNADGPRYQAVKKIYESARMDPDRAIKELSEWASIKENNPEWQVSVSRTTETVSDSFQKIASDTQRIKYGLFWFSDYTDDDKKALRLLSEHKWDEARLYHHCDLRFIL